MELSYLNKYDCVHNKQKVCNYNTHTVNVTCRLVVKIDSKTVFHNLLGYLSDQANYNGLSIDKQISFDYFC